MPASFGGRVRRDDARVRNGEAVLELRVGRDQVDRHRVRLRVADHAALQRARGRGLEARLSRRRCPRRTRPEVGLFTLKMRWNDATTSFTVTRLAVRELDSLAQLEDPRLAAVRRRRQVLGEVGHDRERGVAAGLLEGEQAVVGRLEELPVLERVVDLRVERAARRPWRAASACRRGGPAARLCGLPASGRCYES